jgi:hypothetical protein
VITLYTRNASLADALHNLRADIDVEELGEDSPLAPHEGLLLMHDADPGTLVTEDSDDAGVWVRCVSAGATFVAVLPDATGWLVKMLSRPSREQVQSEAFALYSDTIMAIPEEASDRDWRVLFDAAQKVYDNTMTAYDNGTGKASA